MDKVLDLGQYFYDTYEPVLQILDFRKTAGVKVASEALEYIKNVKPKEGKTFILVNAMGASEYYGENRNGDAFPEADLKKNYKNFETKFSDEGKINGGALVYKHHRNKLAKGDPWYGLVRKAFYNEKMHRVELLLEVDNKKAGDIVERIESGDYPAVSMGVRIPYDVCSICGQKSPKVSEYCDHLRFEMRKIKPDGRRVCAINGQYNYEKHPKPLNFFDISFVFRPADQTGYMLKKVAEDGTGEEVELSAEVAEKMASLSKISERMKKLSDIHKYIRGDVGAVKGDNGDLKVIDKFMQGGLGRAVDQMKPLSDKLLSTLHKYPMASILATLSKNNIILTTPEFIKLVVKKLTGKDVSDKQLAILTTLQAEMFSHLAENPEEVEEYLSLPMFKEVESDPEIDKKIGDIKENRDLSEKSIIKKADTSFFRSVLPTGGDNDRAMTHTESVTLPNGRKFMASQDAIDDAQFWEALKNTSQSMGSSAALAAVYTYLKDSGVIGKAIAPVALVASAYLGFRGIVDLLTRSQRQTGQIRTDSGLKIPRTTTMIEKRSDFGNTFKNEMLLLGVPVGLTVLMNKYYKNKLEEGTAGTYDTTLGKVMDEAGRWSYHHPWVTGGALTLAGAIPVQTHKTIKDYLKKIET